MRLNRLDLTRYGKFTDHVIDFGSAAEAGTDLHIVYGPNEAGKSTLFNGWLDLLFGIGAQSSYNFLHPYPNMKIGAAIELDGKPQEFVRIKRPQNSLLDGRDQPVSDGALLAGLGGLDRDSYQTMFSLDDEILEQGGESILASRGDLGELLFSASAGLGELSQRLVDIRTETEEFYKPRAQKRVLSELKTELAELKAERDRIDTQASKYAQLGKELDEAAARHDEAGEQRKKLRIRLAEITRLLGARPRLAELERLQAQLEPLIDLPDVVPDWRQEVGRLRDAEASLAASHSALGEETERLATELEGIGLDTRILGLQPRMGELDRLRTRHDAAEEDLPERRSALGRIEGRIEQFLIRLGRPGESKADQLLLGTSTTAALRELIDQRANLDVRLAAARKEAADAKANCDDAKMQLHAAGGDPGDPASERRQSRMAGLKETLAALRDADHGPRRQAAERAAASTREKTGLRLKALAPWQGDIDDLRAMTPPSAETLRKWKSDTEETGRKIVATAEEIARITQSLRRYHAETEAMAQSRALLSAGETEALRAARDQAWAGHKSGLDPKSAQTFEVAMRAYDEASDKRAAHQADVARLNEIAVQTAILTADLESAEATRASLETIRTDLQERIAAAVSALSSGLPADMTPEAVEHWLHLRAQALEADDELRSHQRELDIAEEDRQTATGRLIKALAPFDPDASSDDGFEALMSRARDLVDHENRLDVFRQALSEQQRTLNRRDLDLRSAEEEAQAWMLAWKQACDGCWLGERPQAPTAAEVREALPVLADLATAIHESEGLADRIAKMERDQADYVARLHATAADAGIETEDQPAAALARQLSERLAAAEKARIRHDDLTRQRDEALARQRTLAEARAAHGTRTGQMLAALGADTLADAALGVEQALERKQLAGWIEQTASEICETLDVATLEEARAELDAADAAELYEEKLDLESGLETLDAEIQHLFAARTRALEAINAVGGDDAVARIEQQRKTVLLAIAEGAERYLRLSAGIIAMEQALTLYRERHSSSMMQRASDAVRTISRGRYTGLASQPDKGRELLIALQNDGTSKQAAEMSKGARFQLYLALRVAGFYEFAETRQTVPFIADDIMETFDDFRAEETFRLFAGMAARGQVIYLTHHRHLCDIARSVCPDVKIHELTA